MNNALPGHRRNIALVLLFLGSTFFALGQKQPEQQRCFQPNTGPWYPKDAIILRNMVAGFLGAAKTDQPKASVQAVISPHAGYEYSAQCAAYSFKQLEGKSFDKVIILGPSHFSYFRGIRLLDYDSYKTPLGVIKIDVDVVRSLCDGSLIQVDSAPFIREHSVDNMLPFLQLVLKEFSIVPMVVGDISPKDCSEIGRAIKSKCDDKTLVVVSSDFTHYGPDYEYTPFGESKNIRQDISQLDMGAVDKIVALNGKGFDAYLGRTGATICGRNAIRLLLNILPAGSKGRLLNYYLSGDKAKDYTNSVSYASIVFYR
jgi:MEMO1 family protein